MDFILNTNNTAAHQLHSASWSQTFRLSHDQLYSLHYSYSFAPQPSKNLGLLSDRLTFFSIIFLLPPSPHFQFSQIIFSVFQPSHWGLPTFTLLSKKLVPLVLSTLITCPNHSSLLISAARSGVLYHFFSSWLLSDFPNSLLSYRSEDLSQNVLSHVSNITLSSAVTECVSHLHIIPRFNKISSIFNSHTLLTGVALKYAVKCKDMNRVGQFSALFLHYSSFPVIKLRKYCGMYIRS